MGSRELGWKPEPASKG